MTVHRLVRLYAYDFDVSGEEVTEAGIARYAQGTRDADVSNLNDRAFSRFVRDVRAEVAARQQERTDTARILGNK